MLQQNWALIEIFNSGKACSVHFISDDSTVFDRIDLPTENGAEKALKENGFARFHASGVDAAFLVAPAPPFFLGEHSNGRIYSSGRFWKTASHLTSVVSPKQKRPRATVIVEHDGGILLTESRDGLVFLPGGGAKRYELMIGAAARELHEETALTATALLHLFEHESKTTQHSVYLARTIGTPVAGDDAVRLLYLKKADQGNRLNLSPATRDIIKRYHDMQSAHPHWVASLLHTSSV